MSRQTRQSSKGEVIYPDLSYRIVGCALEVYRELGYGFLEKVYENALMVALQQAGVQADQQVMIEVPFRGVIVGQYTADIIVEQKVLLELKSCDDISPVHMAQTLNYLKATNLRLAIILNFTKGDLQFRRVVL
jgi:GxxExxY protein